jgi:Fur family transcriptional regulator, iron response regulator
MEYMLENSSASLNALACGQKLAQMGIRPTNPRVRIAALLFAAPQHLSAEQIMAMLAANGRPVSKATVYNTLKIFAASGLVRQLTIDDSRAWYDSNMGAHYHFHNTESGALIDVPVPEVEFSRLPPTPDGMEVESIDLVIRLRKKR